MSSFMPPSHASHVLCYSAKLFNTLEFRENTDAQTGVNKALYSPHIYLFLQDVVTLQLAAYP